MPSDVEKCECGGEVEGKNGSQLDSSVCSNHFKEIELTSSPASWKHKLQDTTDMLSSSRQEFLPGEPGNNISYGRKGGIFITNAGIVVCILATVFLCVVVGILVHLYYPSINMGNSEVDDDLSWNIGKLHIRDSEDKVRLLTHVVPTYYRLKIKPNYVNFTFEGNVSISIHTHKANVKHISLHAKDLEIDNKTFVLTEQVMLTESANNINATIQTKNQTRRHVSAPPDITTTLTADEDVKVINNLAQPLTTTPPTTTTTIYGTKKLANLDKMVEDKNLTIKSDAMSKNDTNVTKIRKRKIVITHVEFNKNIDRIVLSLESHLIPGVNYTLEISFKGQMDESLTGFYRSSFLTTENKSETLFVTQFEPISARKAFPCFDEPIFKAMFEISVARPVDKTVISNMPLADEEPIPGEDLIWSHFERSQPMSPYLVAYSILNLIPVEIPQVPKSDMALKIWTRKEFKDQTQYAVEVTPKILKFYENYFGLPYALPKLDLLGIPDFAVGAMENWGMMTFRETNLLLDPNSKSMKTRKSIAMVIAHELAHQWFGNLVTMQWWTDVWLNEGFATYLEYIAVDGIEPTWDLLEQFLLDRMPIMISDSLETTRAVSNPINDEVEISQVFDDISYMKAASLLRMLDHILSEDVFHNGLVAYMTKWQYKNADQNMLWDAFTSATNETILPNNVTIADFMNSWTLQPGYPVLNVTRNYENNTVTVTQNRFYMMLPPSGMTNELWYVPISYIIGNVSQEFWDTAPKVWLEKKKSITIQLPEGTNGTEVYFNVHGIGHYRVNYDKKNWKLLQYSLEDNLNDFPVPTRAQLLDDAFNLARAGQLEYSVALDLTKHMIGLEVEMLPWYAVLDNLDYVNRFMQRSNEYNAFQDYIYRLIMPTLKKYGFDNKPTDTAQDSMLRDHLVEWACLIEEEECVNWVWAKFNAWRSLRDPDRVNPIAHNYRATVYATVLRLGTQNEYNFMYERFINSKDPEVQTEFLGALTHTKYQWILHGLFNYSMTKMDLQLVSVLWSKIKDEIACDVGFNFIMSNWPKVYAKLSVVDDQIFQTVIEGAFSHIYSEQQLRQFKRFIQANKEDLKAASNSIHKSLETAVQAVHWRNTKMEEVEKWLVKFKNSNTNDINDLSTLW